MAEPDIIGPNLIERPRKRTQLTMDHFVGLSHVAHQLFGHLTDRQAGIDAGTVRLIADQQPALFARFIFGRCADRLYGLERVSKHLARMFIKPVQHVTEPVPILTEFILESADARR